MTGPGEPGPDSSRDERPTPPSRGSLYVGVAVIALVVFATINILDSGDDVILGTSDTDRGAPLPEFAVPELLGSAEGDANVYQDDCGTAANPCPESQRRVPACEIDEAEVIRVCDLFDRPLVISFWFTGGAECLPAQDLVDAAAREFSDEVNFLSIDVRDDREEARTIVEERGWEIPVGYDADGAVSNLYRVGGCPTVAFAYPGGIFSEIALGSEAVTEQQLAATIEKLIEESARRARTAR
jgi:hypothetical protein